MKTKYKKIDYKKKLIDEINKMPDDLINVETSSELIEGDFETATIKYTIAFYRQVPIKIDIKIGDSNE